MTIMQRQMNPKSSLSNLIPRGKPWYNKKHKKTVTVTARTSPEAKKGWKWRKKLHQHERSFDYPLAIASYGK